MVSTSCSLLHTAVDLVNETKLDDEIKSWLAFAAQKVVEVNALAKALAGQKDEVCFTGFVSTCVFIESLNNLQINDLVSTRTLILFSLAGPFLCQRCCFGFKEVFPKSHQRGCSEGCKFDAKLKPCSRSTIYILYVLLIGCFLICYLRLPL